MSDDRYYFWTDRFVLLVTLIGLVAIVVLA